MAADDRNAHDHATGFLPIPATSDYRLDNARVPHCMLSAGGVKPDAAGLCHVDLVIRHGRILGVTPSGTSAHESDLPVIDTRGALVMPRLVDIHTHLDKGFIWNRAPNPDGTFPGALDTAQRDREASWDAQDLARRMDFGLRCALAHGTGAIRTHLDSIGRQTAISWPVFAELRETWRDVITLQATSLFLLDDILENEEEFAQVVETTARYEGQLGGVTFAGRAPDARTDAALDKLFAAAIRHGLDLDLHVDESDSHHARTLERVADAAIRHRFPNRILCGHCCSASLMEEGDLDRVIDKLARAAISLVSLPMCNMYLQDRASGRTPRWRGVAPVQEFRTAGIPVMFASDNTRDPFFAYGDLDLIEVFREATRIAHLDHGEDDWLRAIAGTPATIMNLDRAGRIESGDPADLLILRARCVNELLSRPQGDRMVLLGGRPIATTPPPYDELDMIA